jgi:hypothetical protein
MLAAPPSLLRSNDDRFARSRSPMRDRRSPDVMADHHPPTMRLRPTDSLGSGPSRHVGLGLGGHVADKIRACCRRRSTAGLGLAGGAAGYRRLPRQSPSRDAARGVTRASQPGRPSTTRCSWPGCGGASRNCAAGGLWPTPPACARRYGPSDAGRSMMRKLLPTNGPMTSAACGRCLSGL